MYPMEPSSGSMQGQEVRCPPRVLRSTLKSSWTVGKAVLSRASGWGMGCGFGRGCIRYRQGHTASSLMGEG